MVFLSDPHFRRREAPWTFEAAMRGSNEALISRCAFAGGGSTQKYVDRENEEPYQLVISNRNSNYFDRDPNLTLLTHWNWEYPYLQTNPYDDITMLRMIHIIYII